MAARLLLLIFLLQFYAPLVHAHPDGGAVAGFAHLHLETPTLHDRDVSPGQTDSMTAESHQVQTIDIGDASEQHSKLLALLVVLTFFLFVIIGKSQRWFKLPPIYRVSHQASPPPNRAPPI